MRELADATSRSRAWACYDCGKCTASCPVARAGGSTSPRRHVLATVRGEWPEITAGTALSACLTCGQCDRRCPAGVTYSELVRELRRRAHDDGLEPDCPHGGALQCTMRLMARGGTQQDRLGWLDGDLETSPETGEVFYWTGCAMYFDALFPELGADVLAAARAAVRVLNRLGVVPVVSPEERCCGHDLLWNGDREGFEQLARHNVALVARSGASLLVVSCAECLRTWRLDYEPFFRGQPPRMLHMAEFLSERLGDLALVANGPQRLTFQDPCRLGRHLGVYDPPRQVLAALPGVELAEMRRTGPAAVCCAGGTWSHCDRYAKHIQVDRLREARATGAGLLVTACPKCRIHFRCAMRDPNLRGEIEIEMRDVAELVAERLAPPGRT